MVENGTHAIIVEIAAAEKINESYVGRILWLTLLAPDFIEAILDGRPEMTLAVLMTPSLSNGESRDRPFLTRPGGLRQLLRPVRPPEPGPARRSRSGQPRN
jgi:hypothetical protein